MSGQGQSSSHGQRPGQSSNLDPDKFGLASFHDMNRFILKAEVPSGVSA
jgi:hypothetical protein